MGRGEGGGREMGRRENVSGGDSFLSSLLAVVPFAKMPR